MDHAEVFSRITQADLYLSIKAELARRSLAEFVRQAWHVHHPVVALRWSWHIDAICDHLEAVSRGEIRRIIINVPPGFMKSLLVSVYWPAWEWTTKPTLQYLASSATNDVALRDARRMHELLESTWYQTSFLPDWKFDTSQDAKGYYCNTAGGARMSRSTGQKVTGLRADRVIVDDPLDARDAHNDKKALAEHVRWFDHALSTRLNSPDSPIVVIMQRLHERDLAGHLLDQGDWQHLCLPNEYDLGRCDTSIGWQDPREDEGELLFPGLLDAEETKKTRRKLGERGYAGQFQQRPAPSEGAVFKEKWFKYWTDETKPKRFDYVFGSWDCTFVRSTDADYVAGQTWGVKGADCYLLGQVRRKLDFAETLEAIKEQQRHWPGMRAVLIEAKANGPAIIEVLRQKIPGLQGVNPQGDSKESRAHATLPRFEAGQVWFPSPEFHGWVQNLLLPEILSFPQARHDDQVDAMTMALNWITESGTPRVWSATLG
jgi:predicted phage terminase large subunit-like protein